MADTILPTTKNRQDVWKELGAKQYDTPEDLYQSAQETAYDVAEPKVGALNAFIKGVPSSKDSGFEYNPSYQPTVGETLSSTITDFARSGAAVLAEWTPEYKAARKSLDELRKTDPNAADQIEEASIGKKLSNTKLAVKGAAAVGEGILTVLPWFKFGRAGLAAGEAALLGKTKVGAKILSSPILKKLYSGGLNGFLYGGLYGLHTQDADWKEAVKSSAIGAGLGIGFMGGTSALAFLGKYGRNKALQGFKFLGEAGKKLGVPSLSEVLPERWYANIFGVGSAMKKYYGDIGENFLNMYKKASRLATTDLGKIQLGFIDNGLMKAPSGFGKAFKGVEFVGDDFERMVNYNQILRGQGAYADKAARDAAIAADSKLQFLDGMRKYYADSANKSGVTKNLLDVDTYLPKHTPVVELSKETRTKLSKAATGAEREAIYAANDPMVKDMVENSVRYGKDFPTLEESYQTYYDYADAVRGGSHTPMGDNKMLQKMVSDGKAATIEEARGKIITDLKKAKLSLTPAANSLDFEREVDLPWYDPNPARVMQQYSFDASMRIEMAKMFGAEDQVIHKMIGSIKSDLTGEISADAAAKSFEEFVRVVTGQVFYTQREQRASAALRALQIPKLAFAQIMNLGQSLNTLLASDLGSVTHGLTTAFTVPEIRNAVERGVLMNQFIRQIFEFSGAGGGSKFTDKLLKYNGFTFTEMFNRVVGSSASDVWGEKNLTKLFDDYGIKSGESGINKMVASSPQQVSTLQKTFDLTLNEGGATLKLNGEPLTTRYVYSPSKTTELAIPKNDFKVENLLDYADKNFDDLVKGDKAVGTWEYEGKIYMDVVKGSDDLAGSLAEANSAQQIGIYDQVDKKTLIVKDELQKYDSNTTIQAAEGGNKGAISPKNKGNVAGAESARTDLTPERKSALNRIRKEQPREYWALKELGLDVDEVVARGFMTPEEKAVAAQTFVERTQFLANPSDLPLFASSPSGKILFQFKTFTYQQARFVTDELKNSFSRGDYKRGFRNLLILSTVFPMTGEVLGDIRSLITQEKRPTKFLDRYISDVFSAGTYGLFYDFYKSAEKGKTSEAILGATVGDAIRYLEILLKSPGQIIGGHGDTAFNNFSKQLLRQSGFGRIGVNTLYPNPQPGKKSTLQSLMDWAAD